MEGGGGEGGGRGGQGTWARHGRRRAQETLRAGSRPQARRGRRAGGGERGGGSGGWWLLFLRHSLSLLVFRRLPQDSQPAAAGLSWWEHTALAAGLRSWGTCSFGRLLAIFVSFFWGTASSLHGGGKAQARIPAPELSPPHHCPVFLFGAFRML